MIQKPIFSLALGFSLALLAVSALPGHAHGKGHGGGHGVHHGGHHGHSSGLPRQTFDSPSPSTGHPRAGHRGDGPQPDHPPSPMRATLLATPQRPGPSSAFRPKTQV